MIIINSSIVDVVVVVDTSGSGRGGAPTHVQIIIVFSTFRFDFTLVLCTSRNY